MILNDLLTRQNVFTKLLLTSNGKDLSKELKVKIMKIRIAYNKIKKEFDSEISDFMEEVMSDEFKLLRDKVDKTQEELDKFNELVQEIDSSYKEFLIQKGLDKVDDVDDSLSEEEYYELVDVNSDNNVVINDSKIAAEDFLELIYDMFVKKE
jgi:hypothetical protein